MSARILFEIEALELRFGSERNSTHVLSIPFLSIEEGERLFLVGPNGSGKTSLLKLLNGLIAPSSGCVRFMGESVSTSTAMRARSVYLHQHPWLLAGTVSYNVAFGCGGRGLSREVIGTRVGASLALVGLSGFERRRYRALSGGEAQRVALARALATGADILLLDEPTASADTESARLVKAALAEAARRGSTLIVSTHESDLARVLASRTIRLESGKIVGDDRTVP